MALEYFFFFLQGPKQKRYVMCWDRNIEFLTKRDQNGVHFSCLGVKRKDGVMYGHQI